MFHMSEVIELQAIPKVFRRFRTKVRAALVATCTAALVHLCVGVVHCGQVDYLFIQTWPSDN